MNKPAKLKLCWNCEGSVATHIENCPYCGVYLSPEHAENAKNSGYSLLSPPYPVQAESKEVPKAPYAPLDVEKSEKEEEPVQSKPSDIYEALFPLVLLTSGTVFLLFGLTLFLFATNGSLTLQWNADYWYIYGLIGLPCLFAGSRSLLRL